MATEWDDEHRTFATTNLWAILATGSRDGSPLQTPVRFTVDDDGDIIVTTTSSTPEWKNAVALPTVSLTVVDNRAHLVVYGTAEPVDEDPERRELTAKVHEAVEGKPVIDPHNLIPELDRDGGTVLRIRPTKFLFQA